MCKKYPLHLDISFSQYQVYKMQFSKMIKRVWQVYSPEHFWREDLDPSFIQSFVKNLYSLHPFTAAWCCCWGDYTHNLTLEQLSMENLKEGFLRFKEVIIRTCQGAHWETLKLSVCQPLGDSAGRHNDELQTGYLRYQTSYFDFWFIFNPSVFTNT